MTVTLLCLAGALLVWPDAGGRSRLPPLGMPRRVTVRLAGLAAPLPVGVAALAVVAGSSTPLVAILAGTCATLGVRAWRSAQQASGDRAALGALAEGLAALAAELRAGRPVEEAVHSASLAGGDQETGSRLVRAVRDPPRHAEPASDGPRADAVGSALGRVAAAVALSSRTGCSLADVVVAVEDDLRARLRADQELRSATAGPRAGALLLAALPVLGLAMGAGIGADPWGMLTTTPVGQVLLVAGVGLEVAGVSWAGRLVRRAIR